MYLFDPDVVTSTPRYQHQHPALSKVDAMKVFRHATDPEMGLKLVKDIIEYNLGVSGPYHSCKVGSLIHAWWCQNAVA